VGVLAGRLAFAEASVGHLRLHHAAAKLPGAALLCGTGRSPGTFAGFRPIRNPRLPGRHAIAAPVLGGSAEVWWSQTHQYRGAMKASLFCQQSASAGG